MKAFIILTVAAGIATLVVIGLAMAAVAVSKARAYMNDNR